MTQRYDKEFKDQCRKSLPYAFRNYSKCETRNIIVFMAIADYFFV